MSIVAELKTDYKEDILETSQQGKRTFNIVSKTGEILFEDVHIEDVSKYTQVGDEYGQAIINAQNNAINEISKGSGLVFDTYQDYLDAKARGEVAVGNTIYIKERNQSEITALQVGYNNSNVKLVLDSLKTTDDTLKNNLKICTLLGDVKTPTTAETVVDVSLSETIANYVFVVVVWGFGWGWNAYAVIPSNTLGLVNIVGAYDSAAKFGRIVPNSNTSIRINSHTLVGSSDSSSNDRIRIYGVIKKS